LLSRMASRMCSYFTTSDCSRGGSRGEAKKAQIPTHLRAAEGTGGAGGGGGLLPWRR
jgi:hypothetical protein